jgi:hypothetical protein
VLLGSEEFGVVPESNTGNLQDGNPPGNAITADGNAGRNENAGDGNTGGNENTEGDNDGGKGNAGDPLALGSRHPCNNQHSIHLESGRQTGIQEGQYAKLIDSKQL